MKVMSKYNMNFNNGSFKRDHIYTYRVEKNMVFVKTEEGTEEIFHFSDFVGLFAPIDGE